MDIQEGRCTIDTWDSLKRELRSQFFPENFEILARWKLQELEQTGTIREYVKQFTGLMLDISDMTENDKIFSFVEGLKLWARTKLHEQRVQDLASAYATTERLFDLSSDAQETETTDRILPKMAVEREVLGEIASLPSQIQGTSGEDPMVRGRPILLSVATYVMGHIGQGNFRIKQPSMPFRPL